MLKNRPELVAKAREVFDLLRPLDDGFFMTKRVRLDAVIAVRMKQGTPFGVTIDFDTLGEKPELKDTVTLRDRDTMKQERIPLSELLSFLLKKIR